MNELTSPKERITEQDCDALILLTIFLPCVNIISGEKDSAASTFQGMTEEVRKTPVCQQRSGISEDHLELDPVGRILSCCVSEFSVKTFSGTMLWSCSDLHFPNQALFWSSKPHCHKSGTINYSYTCLLVLCCLKLIFTSALLHGARLIGLIYPVISFAFFRHSGKTLTCL